MKKESPRWVRGDSPDSELSEEVGLLARSVSSEFDCLRIFACVVYDGHFAFDLAHCRRLKGHGYLAGRALDWQDRSAAMVGSQDKGSTDFDRLERDRDGSLLLL